MTKIKLTGYGGQGIILAGEILAYAAMLDGKESSAIGEYGSAARGGLTTSQVIINDEFIASPFVEAADILIALSQEGYDKYYSQVKSTGLILYESSMIIPKDFPRQYAIPAVNVALSELRSTVVGNMIMLGAFAWITKIVSKRSLISAVKDNVSSKFTEVNIKGIEIGYEKFQEIFKG
ncbi:MAG: 2-oxoacid:acceptor oxidoreductase family protein [candidate division WOR-3 bacterium]|nr:2-oxoacid:acceptor oxidoreductase family protein [candidate division WOR-3 bacterium]MCX7757419.1 2-oxoacid:acceptor oxidoreductase family protein [candidate division WOR-3 bacterium]MDW7988170.1 2-oxoacid:acceptor oxidoreductase family protein [candidate division WOR-3 bacterium]